MIHKRHFLRLPAILSDHEPQVYRDLANFGIKEPYIKGYTVDIDRLSIELRVFSDLRTDHYTDLRVNVHLQLDGAIHCKLLGNDDGNC